MVACLARFTLAFFALVLVTPEIFAHDHWIQRGGHKNAAGEWCCGEGDCFVIAPERVTRASDGSFMIWSGQTAAFGSNSVVEVVPEQEAQPSPDGAYWRCKRPDGSRRCFFAPPPAT